MASVSGGAEAALSVGEGSRYAAGTGQRGQPAAILESVDTLAMHSARRPTKPAGAAQVWQTLR